MDARDRATNSHGYRGVGSLVSVDRLGRRSRADHLCPRFLILHRDEATGELHVVDGQQRLLTLVMMLDLLDDRARGEVTRREARSGHTDQASANTEHGRGGTRFLPAESYIRPVADDSHPTLLKFRRHQ